MFYIEDGREHFYQWDTDRRIVVEDQSIKEVHFCNRTGDCSLVSEVYFHDNDFGGVYVANVPNILLQTDWKIRVYAWDGKHTRYDACYEVKARTKPTDYAYEETEILTWNTINEKVEEALGKTGYYTPHVEEDGTLTWETSTDILPDVLPVNIKGEKGDKGEPGNPGATGARGEKGEKGDKGDKGDKGERGLQGEPGKDGSVSFEALTDAQKAELKGDKGDKGDRGEKGNPGRDGVSPTHEWNGTTLIITSASGTTAQDLQGEKGAKGEKGDRGERGEKGEKGNTPVRGIDYWTEADEARIINEVVNNGDLVTDNELKTTLNSYLTKSEATGQYVTNTRFSQYSAATAELAKQAKELEETKANAADVYTKSEVDNKIAAGGGGSGGGDVDLSNYYTKPEVDEMVENVEVDLTGYVKTADLSKANVAYAESANYALMADCDVDGNDITYYYASKEYVDTAIANVPTGGGGSGGGKINVTFDWNTALTEEQLNIFSDIHTLFNEGGFAAVDSKYEVYTNRYGAGFKMVGIEKHWYGGGYNAINIYFSNGLFMIQKAFKYNKVVNSNEYSPGEILTQANYTNYISTGGGGSWTYTTDTSDGNLYNANEVYIMAMDSDGNSIFSYCYFGAVVFGDCRYNNYPFAGNTSDYWYYDGSSIQVSGASSIYTIGYK